MEIPVILVSADQERRTVLQMQVDSTAVARVIQSHSSFPIAVSDPILRRMHEAAPAVIIVDLPPSLTTGVRAIELLRLEFPETAIFAMGETNSPQTIITAMRAGAQEYLERPTSTGLLLEAFVRVTSANRKTQRMEQRGKTFTFVNSRGGAGATTVAVNTALHLQKLCGSVVLVDLAPLAHATLHLNVHPNFTLRDALRNLQRLDNTLLEGYLTPAVEGLQLLAGAPELSDETIAPEDLARLFDLLVMQFQYVVVDASSRMDRAVKLVCDLSDNVMIVTQPEVTALWSTSKVQDYLGEALGSNHVRVVLNRFRKMPGLTDTFVRKTTRANVIYRVPNSYNLVSSSIERGVPVAQENHTEISHAFVELAAALAEKPVAKPRKGFSIFGA
jgi:pilus assembly protein CpaE